MDSHGRRIVEYYALVPSLSPKGLSLSVANITVHFLTQLHVAVRGGREGGREVGKKEGGGREGGGEGGREGVTHMVRYPHWETCS